MSRFEIEANSFIPKQEESPNVFYVENGITKRTGRLNTVELVDEKTIRKISNINEAIRPYRLRIAAWAMSEAKFRGVNVPTIVDYYQNRLGQEILIMERLRGKTLLHFNHYEKASSMLSVGNQMNLLENITSNYGWIDPQTMAGKSKDWKAFIMSYAQIYGTALIKNGIITEKDLQAIAQAIQETDLNTSPYLVHRDIKLENLIKDERGKTWIIDWENVMLGDPLYDLAIFGLNHRDILWESLALSKKSNYDKQKYLLYEAIAIIGLIDFCCRNKLDFKGRQRQFYEIIKQSKLLSSKLHND